MKYITVILLSLFLVGCVSKRIKRVNSRKHKNFTTKYMDNKEQAKVASGIIKKVNTVAVCELITETDTLSDDFVISIKERDLEDQDVGAFNGASIFIDTSWRQEHPLVKQAILLHEIGHALGYMHTSWSWHIMHKRIHQGNVDEAAFVSFVKDIKLDFGCKK